MPSLKAVPMEPVSAKLDWAKCAQRIKACKPGTVYLELTLGPILAIA